MPNISQFNGRCAGGIAGALFLITSCATPPPDAPVMPPRPPSERIKSTILPPDPEPIPDSAPILDPEQTPEPEPIPRPATAPSLPDGITLSLAGSPVSMERLRTRTAEEAGTETVQVQAAATTPYRDVKDVLEKLHDLGYLVEFVPQESP